MNDGTLAAAIQESNDILQDEATRLRETNATLRVVIRALRRANESLRQQVSNAAENDDTFKRFCAGEFDEIDSEIEAQVVEEGEGVFPEPEDGGTTESTL